jgi:hypothetical protein
MLTIRNALGESNLRANPSASTASSPMDASLKESKQNPTRFSVQIKLTLSH